MNPKKLYGYLVMVSVIIWLDLILFPLLLYGLIKLKDTRMAIAFPLFYFTLWVEGIKNKGFPKIRCEKCGGWVVCGIHGAKHIKKIFDSFDNPVYFCERCVIEYKTVFGAIVHMHNPFVEYAEEFDEALKEFLNEQAKHE